MITYAGIDGTGTEWFSRERNEYRAAFESSHVRKLHAGWRGARKYYEGPKIAGLGTAEITSKAVAWVSATAGKRGVVLAGYSRGGAAAIAAAQHLDRISIPVHALLLFDAVDRSLVIGSTVIPKNVAAVFHAMRDPSTSSREGFGNCGLQVADETATSYERKYFFGTHGALGGVPWTANDEEAGGTKGRGRNRRTVAAPHTRQIYEGGLDGATNVSYMADAIVAGQVWHWMTGNLRALIPGSL